MSILDDQKLFSKGLQLFKDNNLDNSLNYINKIKSKNLNTLKLLSQIYKKKNDIKNTKIILNKIINLDKKNLFALYNLGEISKIEKDFKKAEKFYLTLISYNENFTPAHFNLASIYEDKGELSLAKKIYLKLVDIDKKNFAAYFNLQRLDEDLITNETIKYINQEIEVNDDERPRPSMIKLFPARELLMSKVTTIGATMKNHDDEAVTPMDINQEVNVHVTSQHITRIMVTQGNKRRHHHLLLQLHLLACLMQCHLHHRLHNI